MIGGLTMAYLCSIGFFVIMVFLPAMERLPQIILRFITWILMCLAFLFTQVDAMTIIGSATVTTITIYEMLVDLFDYKKNKEKYRRHTY